MIPLKPLPPAQQPIVQANTPSQPYVQYFQSLDLVVRSLLASVPALQTSGYTIALKDAWGTVEMNLAGANTITIPLNSAIPFPIGTPVRLVQIGAGASTVAGALGVTIRSRLGLQLAGQYAVATIYKRGTDEWVLSGDLI